MKFEIIKDIKLDGTTYYLVYTTDSEGIRSYHKLFSAEQEAYDFMDMLIENHKDKGYPKQEAIYSQTF
jgi:hypothetical protein